MIIIIDQHSKGTCLIRTADDNFCGQRTNITIRVITIFGRRAIQYTAETCPNCGGERIIRASRYAKGKAIPTKTINRFN